MERLTEWNDEQTRHAYYPRCFKDPCYGNGCKINDCSFETAVCDRLAAYEDTGLEPEAVETVKLALCAKHMVDLETLNNTPISRLVELAEADKDGRCVVLPCKVGDTVYTNNRVLGADNAMHDEICTRRIKGYGGNALNKMWLIANGDYCDLSIFPSEFGKTVFLTREEAEKALRKMEGAT